MVYKLHKIHELRIILSYCLQYWAKVIMDLSETMKSCVKRKSKVFPLPISKRYSHLRHLVYCIQHLVYPRGILKFLSGIHTAYQIYFFLTLESLLKKNVKCVNFIEKFLDSPNRLLKSSKSNFIYFCN